MAPMKRVTQKCLFSASQYFERPRTVHTMETGEDQLSRVNCFTMTRAVAAGNIGGMTSTTPHQASALAKGRFGAARAPSIRQRIRNYPATELTARAPESGFWLAARSCDQCRSILLFARCRMNGFTVLRHAFDELPRSSCDRFDDLPNLLIHGDVVGGNNSLNMQFGGGYFICPRRRNRTPKEFKSAACTARKSRHLRLSRLHLHPLHLKVHGHLGQLLSQESGVITAPGVQRHVQSLEDLAVQTSAARTRKVLKPRTKLIWHPQWIGLLLVSICHLRPIVDSMWNLFKESTCNPQTVDS